MRKIDVSQPSPNVFFINVDSLKTRFLLSSDVHFDHPACDRVGYAKALRDCDYAIDAGDFFCAMQGRNDKRGRKGDVRPEHQRDDYFNAIVDDTALFKNIGKYVIMGLGNHEMGVIDKNELDLTKMLCDKIGARRASYDYWVVFSYNGRRVVMHVNHGSGGGGDVSAGVPISHRMAAYSQADVHWTGHVHQQWLVTRQRASVNHVGKVTVDRELHVCTPGYKEEYLNTGGMGFHLERNRPPKPIGAAMLSLYRDDDGVLRPKIEMVVP